jgi:hypothetical protein
MCRERGATARSVPAAAGGGRLMVRAAELSLAEPFESVIRWRQEGLDWRLVHEARETSKPTQAG